MLSAAYNAGFDAVDRYHGVPPFPETQDYVNRVLALMRRYQSQST
jgi:soluble lytic murein transglycosylase-like protein